ncbi:ATP-binding cassette domain-containing protein [Mycoplasmopsis cricetuli]|uniref:ATP-binding cassette domain-containing protein n=1 Tax=Mycoplasmopsis cricetuli TaxID=171283 RepID=UPI0012EBEA86|nr:ABC transporter ATP-binding protein [Mycoplasmopsis cricetuli]
MSKFLIYQGISLMIEIFWQSLWAIVNLLIKKQINILLINKKAEIFKKISFSKPKYIKKEKITQYIFNLEVNLNSYVNSYLNTYYNIVWNVVIFISLFVFIIVLSFVLSPWILIFLALVIVLVLFFYFFPIYSTKKNKAKNKIMLENKEREISRFTNLISNFKNFYWNNKLYNFQAQSSKSFTKINKLNLQMYQKKYYYNFIEQLINATINQLSIISISIITLLNPINKLLLSTSEHIFSAMKTSTQDTIENVKEIKIINNLKKQIEEIKFSNNETNWNFEPINEIKINNLNLQFNDRLVFKNFNYQFNLNYKYLIEGKSGIGKSSLVKIILNELTEKNYKGNLLFNNKQVTQEMFYNLYSQIIYLTNEEFEYKSSAKEVLTLYQKNIDKIKLKKAAQLSCIDFDLNQDFDLLSTGQKQRIKIARWFYFKRQILILDEALSGIDQNTRLTILKNVVKKNNSIVIVISHHLTKTEKQLFDQILNLNSLEIKKS